mgnify:CR=1 FL=1
MNTEREQQILIKKLDSLGRGEFRFVAHKRWLVMVDQDDQWVAYFDQLGALKLLNAPFIESTYSGAKTSLVGKLTQDLMDTIWQWQRSGQLTV